ncbi:hypothetical protein N5D48_20295 [Pseudomonas sp. GD03858]|uniref:hypothetical protein n=1 Tax=unclassified Pseudomonas TaxID=196821 RepID=UPI00244D56B5|nr:MULTISPECIES: hypothetical protein [unclassified Pseudomonas]MDH0649799.1 hypothetical protein [Pseudomonas sp. GD03867]MDH0664748.1 hypothetical protein [Pseudomonas sp. GD03858]
MAAKAKKVSERDLDALEQQIPLHASEATHSAYLRALQANQGGVLCVDEGELVRVGADGARTVLGKAGPRRKVRVGEVISVRRVDDETAGGRA